MKIKNYLFRALLLFSILPTCLLVLLRIAVNNSSATLTIGDLILPLIYLVASIYFICKSYFVKPIIHFLNTINRSIKGDYRARFSCSDYNELRYISDAYNQLMSTVEQNTEELRQNRLLQDKLYENEKIYRSALELTSENLFEADLKHNRIDYGAEKFNRAFPLLHTEMYSEVVEFVTNNAIFPDDVEKYYHTFSRENLTNIFSKNDIHEISLDHRILSKDSREYYWVKSTVIHLADSNMDSLKIIGYTKNIDVEKRHEQELLQQSQKDSLTGLYNKKVTRFMIEDYINGIGKDEKHALIMMDVDNFKSINDTYGHIQGDNVLLAISENLPHIFRSSDILGRIGGDEFFIFIKDYGSDEQLLSKLTALSGMFGEIQVGENSEKAISGSIGVAIYPIDANNYHDLYKKADMSLYYAKEHGKDCFYVYDRYLGNREGAERSNALSIDMSAYEKYANKNISANEDITVNEDSNAKLQ